METPVATVYRKVVSRLPTYLRDKLPGKVRVVGISRRESLRLNLVYRDKNKDANVFSFRYDPDYGEILVCPEVIRREAKEQENSYKYQMTWMILHGMLHLAGMHHEKSKMVAKRVVRLESDILAQLFLRESVKQ